MNAIPTKYNGVQFRSRLEARWAAFFDLLDWPWEYEPIDLDGYIPDFLIRFPSPLIVEVKPLISNVYDWTKCGSVEHDLVATAIRKIETSGWHGEALLVGSLLHSERTMGSVDGHEKPINVGLHLEWFRPEGGDLTSVGGDHQPGDQLSGHPFGIKSCCGGPVNVVMYFGCLRCGDHDKGPTLMSSPRVVSLWNIAGNLVQWRGSEARP